MLTKKQLKEKQEKTFKFLKKAGIAITKKEKENIEVDRQWEGQVMTRIRKMAAFKPRPLFLPTFEHLVWRLVPVASLVLVGLIVFFLEFDLTPEYDLVQLINGAEELMMLPQIFGI